MLKKFQTESCSYDYDDPSYWSTVCPFSNCNGTRQSPININTTDVQTCNGLLEFSSDYEDGLYGEYERKGFALQFTVKDWDTEAPTVTQSYAMYSTTYRQV